MCVTVRSTSTMRSRFQLLRMLRKWSSCSLLMYCSPRLAMYGWTLRGPASRLPGSTSSASSPSAVAAGAGPTRLPPSIEVAARGGLAGAPGRSGFLVSAAGSLAAAGAAAPGFFGGGAVLCGGDATALPRSGSGLCAVGFLTAGGLAAVLHLADLGPGP